MFVNLLMLVRVVRALTVDLMCMEGKSLWQSSLV